MNAMFIARRGFAKFTESAKAAHAAVAPAKITTPIAHAASQPTPGPVKQDLKVTRLPNDLLVASEDSGFPLVRISVAVKAGARHEPVELPGLSHALRNASSLATKQCTAFGLARNLEQLGANFEAVTTRDLTVYSLECSRSNLQEAVKHFSYAITEQEFRDWEVLDACERMRVDLSILKHHPEIRVVENLHKAAYHSGLGNSLYAAEFAIKHLKGRFLSDFARQTFIPSRVVISGGNVHHDELLYIAQKYFKFDNVGWKQDTGLILRSKIAGADPEAEAPKVDAGDFNDKPAKYFGGELFEDSVDHLAYAIYVTEGPGLNKPKELLAMKLIQQVIGTEPQIKWSDGKNSSALARAVGEVTENPFAVSGVTFCHSDSSLSGISVVSHARDLGKILKAGVDVLHGKAGVDQKRLQAAKSRLISHILMASEYSADSVFDAAVQASINGTIISPREACAIVEKISLEDIIALAKKSVSGKPTLAAAGNLSHCPRIEQLLAK